MPWFRADDLPTPFKEWACASGREFQIIRPVVETAPWLVCLSDLDGIEKLNGLEISALEAASVYSPSTHELVAEEVFAWTPISS